MATASVKQGPGARAGAQASPKWRGQPLMEPLPDGLTAPFPVAWSQTVAMPLGPAKPSDSQTFGVGMRFCRVCWCIRTTSIWGGNLPFFAAFPLHASSYLQDCLAFLLHNAGFYRLSWGICSECPLQCPFPAMAFGCSLKLMSWPLWLHPQPVK